MIQYFVQDIVLYRGHAHAKTRVKKTLRGFVSHQKAIVKLKHVCYTYQKD